MRSVTRCIEWGLLGVGAWSSLACGDSETKVKEVAERDQAALAQSLAPEEEPNSTSATATTIGNDVVVRANLFPNGDIDFFRFNAPANSRVYAATMTTFGGGVTTGLNDSVLALFGTNGTTLLELDDDHGAFGEFASSIAGAQLTTAGNYFLRVSEASDGQLAPYDLHLRVRSGAPAAETEPNNTTGTAQAFPGTGWVSGQTSSASDEDHFSLTLAAGDTVFASLDLDPERDDVTWDGFLLMAPFDGTFLVGDDIADDPSDNTSEALFATVKHAGTYTIGVASFSGSGTYQLSVSVHPATAEGRTCVTYPSQDVFPRALADGGRVTSVVNVPVSRRIGDLDVSLELDHDWIPDLDVHLRSPAGNDVALFTNVGDPAFTALDLNIDDEAAISLGDPFDNLNSWTQYTALHGLSVQPEVTQTDGEAAGSRLHWFDGQDAAGTWTLVIDDDGAGDTGTLGGWGITVCEPPAGRTCSGTSLVQAVNATFNSGPEGFTASGGWARGAPTGPPHFAGCNAGSAGCWKTNLAGPYAANSTQNLVSPTIDLTNAVAPITLSWAMKYQLETSSRDHAWVEVRDSLGARTDRAWEFRDSTMRNTVGVADEFIQEFAGWGVHTVDLSRYAGRTIQVAFHLDSNASVQLGGFAVDDFSVTHCGCGDGVVGVGEQCDLGAQNGQAGRCCSASCTFVTNGTGCSDDSVCTSGETCTNGVCGSGSPVSCDDNNVCTDNSCNPGTGCVYTPNTAPCPNGTCSGGMCQMGGAGGMAGGAGAGGGPAGGAGMGGNPAGGGGVGGAGAGGAPTGGVGGSLAGMGGAAGNAGASGGGAAGAAGGQAGGGGQTGGGSGGGAQGGNAGTPPGGNAGEGGAPEGGAGQGGTGEGGEGGEATGGSATGGNPTGGSSTGGLGGNLPDSGVSGTGGTSGDQGGEGGEAVSDRHAKDIESDGSCGCRVPGTSRRGELPALLAFALGAVALRRRKRR